MRCPCGSDESLDRCCGRFHRGYALPETAEELMRSRYAAYVLDNISYLSRTHDPATIHEFDEPAARKWAREAAWLGLTIVAKSGGTKEDNEGVVEFVAQYEVGGVEHTHREESFFRKVDGIWRYASGRMVRPQPVKRASPKVGRNDACPCGSGKKYKRCCGR